MSGITGTLPGIRRRSLYQSDDPDDLTAQKVYEEQIPLIPEEIIKKWLKEDMAAKCRKHLKRVASRLIAIRMDTTNDNELLDLVIFSCEVLMQPGLFNCRHKWFKKELKVLYEKRTNGVSSPGEDWFLNALKSDHYRAWIESLICLARTIRYN
ncbi:hypothetical protein Forpi1262_v014492 [Fusarium oxysporum f. sp. raphani]|uniref:Uncharacterized protein n=1 Tax=Fusarium oxysporum f. sp. raphani TaxID=96318 RepID=A0A8J5UHI8_FUSOX|nr:hypothetical protein Forpi1262_v014492 [Fusarium oxysporum f. sp. raphani]KAH7465079.1 hypothetical protein FOMA001_g17276 [Fusarium oxysporum f. sp. matthiolae]